MEDGLDWIYDDLDWLYIEQRRNDEDTRTLEEIKEEINKILNATSNDVKSNNVDFDLPF